MSLSSPAAVGADPYPAELKHPAEGAMEACRICGLRRGRRDADELWVQDGALDPRGPRVTRRDTFYGGVVDELKKDQPWRWRHVACEPTAATLVRGVIGVELDEPTARQVVAEAGITTARNENTVSRKPWGHVTLAQREVLRREVDRAALAGIARMHVAGRCGWCGRSRSRSWSASGLSWAGTDEVAPLCEECAAARQQVRNRFDDDVVRRVAMRSFVGLVDAFGETRTYGFRYAAEVIPDKHRHDDEQWPWTYSPTGLAAVKAAAYTAETESIADEQIRQMQQRIVQAKWARARADQAAADAAESAEPAVAW